MRAKGFIDGKREGWLLRVGVLDEGTILYRGRCFCPGDDSL